MQIWNAAHSIIDTQLLESVVPVTCAVDWTVIVQS